MQPMILGMILEDSEKSIHIEFQVGCYYITLHSQLVRALRLVVLTGRNYNTVFIIRPHSVENDYLTTKMIPH